MKYNDIEIVGIGYNILDEDGMYLRGDMIPEHRYHNSPLSAMDCLETVRDAILLLDDYQVTFFALPVGKSKSMPTIKIDDIYKLTE